MTKPTQDKETLREERSRLEMIAFAAWVNVSPDKIPPEFRAPTCEHTMAAWKRVADAIEADVFERLRTPSEGVIEASKPFRKGVGETAGRIWQAMLDAFEHGNGHEWEYTGTDPHGSHKGERAYRCRKCKAFDYRPDGE